ncbi:uncharacterized protein TNCV_3090051 [Trichonephila clavipes]|nr:uncharacterized protein TNCV_3090051 [Trichonephila clavipes]
MITGLGTNLISVRYEIFRQIVVKFCQVRAITLQYEKIKAMGSLVVRAWTSDRKAWVRCPMSPNTIRVHTKYVLVKSVDPKSCGLCHEHRDWGIFPSPSVPCRNCGGGDRWFRYLSSLRGISPS